MRKRIARNVQPEIIDRLFIEQSEPWEKLARSHSKSVWEATQEFMDSVITHLTDEYTADALILDIIGPKMDDRSVALEVKLQELPWSYQKGYPIT
jgi:hypothetical protein